MSDRLVTAIAGTHAGELELALKAAGPGDASLLRAGVLRLAELNQQPKPGLEPELKRGPGPTAVEGARYLADWLVRARLNDMVIDRTMETLTSEDVFNLDDLVIFSRMGRFDQVLKFAEKRAAQGELDHIFLDTPGQIEIFTWSASGTVHGQQQRQHIVPPPILYTAYTSSTTRTTPIHTTQALLHIL